MTKFQAQLLIILVTILTVNVIAMNVTIVAVASQIKSSFHYDGNPCVDDNGNTQWKNC